MTDIAFQVKFAGRVIRVHALSPKLATFCQDFVTDRTPQRSVVITAKDIAWEREHAQQDASYEHLEQLALCRKVSSLLLDCDTLLFHGSCVAVDGKAYIFAAPSGVGKSTHAGLWRDMLGERVVMINDDKPFLKVRDDKVVAHGSPWTGEHHLGTNTHVPLKAICFLSRDTANHLRPLTAEEALPLLLNQVYCPDNDGAMKKVLPLLDKLTSLVELYALGCTREPEAARVAYEGMRK